MVDEANDPVNLFRALGDRLMSQRQTLAHRCIVHVEIAAEVRRFVGVVGHQDTDVQQHRQRVCREVVHHPEPTTTDP